MLVLLFPLMSSDISLFFLYFGKMAGHLHGGTNSWTQRILGQGLEAFKAKDSESVRYSFTPNPYFTSGNWDCSRSCGLTLMKFSGLDGETGWKKDALLQISSYFIQLLRNVEFIYFSEGVVWLCVTLCDHWHCVTFLLRDPLMTITQTLNSKCLINVHFVSVNFFNRYVRTYSSFGIHVHLVF